MASSNQDQLDTALHNAVGGGSIQDIVSLLDRHADINSLRYDGTPLHYASWTGRHQYGGPP